MRRLLPLALLLAGCSGGSESGDTSAAAAEVKAAAAQGGAKPDPKLPKPMGASPGNVPNNGKTGKFGAASPG